MNKYADQLKTNVIYYINVVGHYTDMYVERYIYCSGWMASTERS